MEKDSKRKYVVDKKKNNDNCSVHFSIKITFQMKHLMKKTFSQALQNKEVLHFFFEMTCRDGMVSSNVTN